MPVPVSVNSLTLRERAAQLIFPRIGSNMNPPIKAADDAGRIASLLSRCPVGGLILFNGTLSETPGALAELQSHCKVPLLIGSDIERGTGQQISGATIFPHAMAFGQLGQKSEELLERSARETAREALSCGIHIAFAPVADVNRNPRNPIIATRAFDTDPEAVGRLLQAYIRGCHREGLFTTAKHFPGHGNTSEDSHATLPQVSSSREDLDATDLVPFKAAIKAQTDLIMTAHVAYPALDLSGNPATASSPILQDLLRSQLGYQGVVITDSLLMGAMRERYSDIRTQVVALLRAGIDIFLDPTDPEGFVEAIVAAVEQGELDDGRVNDSAGRVLRLKETLIKRFGDDFFEKPWDGFPLEEVGSREKHDLARDIALRACSVLKSDRNLLPVFPEAGGHLLLLYVDPHRADFEAESTPLADALRAAIPSVTVVGIGSEPDREKRGKVLEMARQAERVIIALVVKPAAWRQFGLLPDQEELVQEVIRHTPAILVSLGSPIIFDRFGDAPVHVCTYSDALPSQLALVDLLIDRGRD